MANAAPIVIEAINPDAAASATVIFLHGFGDDAHGWTDLVSQIHSASKLPHVKWILPNAPENRDAMAQAWYYPKPFSPIPMPRRTGEPPPEEDEAEDDEAGMMKSVEYVCGLIDKEVEESKVPLERIVVGGFSQGCAISLLVAMRSRYAGRLRGIIGLSGYLPLKGTITKALEERGNLEEQKTEYFVVHGSRDQLVPRRLFASYSEKMKEWYGEKVETRLYEGLGHTTNGTEVRELCEWLELVL